MTHLYLSPGLFPDEPLRGTVEFIASLQQADGAIPWFDGHSLDPWDHVEAAMGLTVGGEYDRAERAYRWLGETQLSNGGWWASYQDGKGCETHCQSNFSAYIATGLWHYYRVTGRSDLLAELWPCVRDAMNFVVSMQRTDGTIAWAVDSDGRPDEGSLLAGCASICKSLECALAIAAILGHKRPEWAWARRRLLIALRDFPQRFKGSHEETGRFSMDWFYPILAGVYSGSRARQRLHEHWERFVVPGLGCRCVDDQPWVAIAESCELVMALLAAGNISAATELFNQLHRWRCPQTNGGYWTGYQYQLDIPWPREQTSWTAAAVLLAADALNEHTPAADLFLRPQWSEEDESQQQVVLAAVQG